MKAPAGFIPSWPRLISREPQKEDGSSTDCQSFLTTDQPDLTYELKVKQPKKIITR